MDSSSFNVLDSLLVFPPDECSTPTSPSVLNPFSSLDSSSASSSFDHTVASSSHDFSSFADPWAGFPTGDYADYDGALPGGAGGMMGLDMGGQGTNGIELMDIAPLPGVAHAMPHDFSYQQHSTIPPYCPSSSYNPAYDPYQLPVPTATGSDDQGTSPSPSSQYSSLPRTPPSITSLPSSSQDSGKPSVSKRARRESSINPYASVAGSSHAGSPEPESLKLMGLEDEQDSKKGAAGAAGGSAQKGKKRKQLPTTAEFQHPDVSGLTKKEARLVKNRAAAFLSRQRKREQFDELEIQCTALVAENAQLKAALAAKASPSSAPAPSAPKVTKRQAAALAAAATTSAPQIDSAQVSALQSDLANLRTLLHASTAREAALEVEMASLRAQLGGSPSNAKPLASSSSGSLSPMLSGGLLNDPEQAASGAQPESGVVVGGRRVVGRGQRDREGKRVGGVALMVILFSFALFTLPPGTISNLPLRASSPTTSSFPFASLGRVLQGGPSAASFAAAIEREDAVDADMGVCEMDPSSHNNSTTSPSTTEECLAKEERRTSTASPPTQDLSHWSSPSSLDLASPASPASDSRRSFSLTLLRPVPSSPASLHLTNTNDGVDDVLERWLGLSLFDQGVVGPSPVASSSSPPGDETEPGGWFVVDSSESSSLPPAPETEQPQEAPKAWDGSTLERMELDDVLLGLGSPTPSSTPLASSPSSSLTPKASYLTLPGGGQPSEDPLSGANDTFVRLDLELEVGVRRREVAIVGREEVGRMMLLGGGSGGKSLPGSWVV